MRSPIGDWVFNAPGEVERIEARFSGLAFSPHRHDTYAIGLTLEGVQSFDYRGVTRHSLPGQLVVLHPDELHDGRAGDGGAFRYRTAYVSPAALQSVLGGRPLPFIEGGICGHPPLRRAVQALLEDLDQPLGGFAYEDVLQALALALGEAAGNPEPASIPNRRAAFQARAFIDENLLENLQLKDLERVTQHDRWQLSRDFRAVFGASPYRYLVFRRLDAARGMIMAGGAIADVAHACGFADQSHLTRHFRKAFGLTPQAWRRAGRTIVL
jgi:AraC-like DNA-binding protein